MKMPWMRTSIFLVISIIIIFATCTEPPVAPEEEEWRDPACISCHPEGIAGFNEDMTMHTTRFVKTDHGPWHANRQSHCYYCHAYNEDVNAGFCIYCHGAN